MIRLHAFLRTRVEQTQASNERGAAMVAALIFMILLFGLTTSVTMMLANQPKLVYQAERTTKTVNAAQAGMQVTLGMIRTAKTGLYGDRTKLPCTVSGSVDGSASSATYTVAVAYFAQDPAGRSKNWRNANKLSCGAGGVASTPRWAVITSTGTGAPVPGIANNVGNRAVEGTYVFKVANINIPGGAIQDLSTNYCLVADSAAVGSAIRFRPSGSTDCADQTRASWVYANDYEIKLASTLATTPLCVSDPSPTSPGVAARDALIALCQSNSTRWNQLWSWTGDYSWRGQKPDIVSGVSATCLAPEDTTWNGKKLQVRFDYCNGQFNPTFKVGAGAAGKSTNQIVNYAEFGRCLDVTTEDINYSYMISYPCKQDPSGKGTPPGTFYLLWNHKWYYDEPAVGSSISAAQRIYVSPADTPNVASSRRCLTTPATGVTPAYPVFSTCSSTEVRQDWKRYGNTSDYSTSYLLVDTYGRCLAVDASSLFAGAFSKITVTMCDGSLGQKWNAPPDDPPSTVGSYREVPVS